MAGSTAAGMRSASSMASSQSEPSPSSSPVTAGVGGVGDVQRAPRQRPRHPGVDRAEAQVARCGRGRPCRGAWRAWWPTRWARPGCPGPAAPGRCPRCAGPASRCPGPTGSPRGRGPTRWSRPAGWRCPRRRPARPRPGAAPATSSTAAAMAGGVELDEARAPGTTGSTSTWWTWSTAPSRVDHAGAHARGAHVDDEDRAHGQPDLAEGRRQPELARVEDAVGVEGLLQRAQHVEGPAEGVGQEPAPVDAHAVVVADGPAVRAHRVHDDAPRRRCSSARPRRRRRLSAVGARRARRRPRACARRR